MGRKPVTRRMDCNLPYINAYQDRHGTWRYYYRRAGRQITLQGAPGTPEFVASYNAAVEKSKPPVSAAAPAAGTLSLLRQSYYESAEFANLAESTRREMRYAIDSVCKAPSGAKTRGDNPVKLLERRHILAWRDKLATKPGAANKMLRAMKVLLSFAVDRGMIATNPAFKIKPLKGGRFRSWHDEELEQFEQRWPLGTLERTAYALALYTAQRRTDLAAFEWTDIAGAVVHVTQHKTGTTMVLPLHPQLREALTAWKRRGKTILVGERGDSLTPITLGAIMAAAIEAAGLPDDCVLHGLRKTAARIIAETGGNVGSMTGHLTAQMAAEYSRDADQRKQAKATVLKWARSRRQVKK